MVEGSCACANYPSTSCAGSPPHELVGRNMAPACAVHPHPLRAFCRASPRRRLGRVPAGAARHIEAAAVGAGADGDPGKRARPSAGASHAKYHPCRGARHARRAVRDGGGTKMRRALGRHRRDLGRSARARLHRDAAACGRVGAVRRAVLAGPARRQRQSERRADALADRERAVAPQRSRSESAGSAGVGCRAVPRPWRSAGPVEHRA